jgi:hypothetical protein
MGQIFEVTEGGLRISFSSKSEFDRFNKDVVDVLMKLDNLLRLISPLPGMYLLSCEYEPRFIAYSAVVGQWL